METRPVETRPGHPVSYITTIFRGGKAIGVHLTPHIPYLPLGSRQPRLDMQEEGQTELNVISTVTTDGHLFTVGDSGDYCES